MILNYTTFIDICFNIRTLSVQYEYYENDIDKIYFIEAIDKNKKYECEINNIDNSTEFTDFEANYKSKCNRQLELLNSDGVAIYSPTLEDMMGRHTLKIGYKATVISPAANYFDNVISEQLSLCGGEYWVNQEDLDKVHEDDYVEFSIIDKDNVLGLFSYYGLTQGTDILELNKFVRTDYVKKGNINEGYYSDLSKSVKGANGLIVGLYSRVKYTSCGEQPVRLIWRLHYYD